jgi:hypothetical protein
MIDDLVPVAGTLLVAVRRSPTNFMLAIGDLSIFTLEYGVLVLRDSKVCALLLCTKDLSPQL